MCNRCDNVEFGQNIIISYYNCQGRVKEGVSKQCINLCLINIQRHAFQLSRLKQTYEVVIASCLAILMFILYDPKRGRVGKNVADITGQLHKNP